MQTENPFTTHGKEDNDLAALYQVEVKQMNRQVKRNKERFPEDFMFQLTKEELASLKCQNGTSNSRGGEGDAGGAGGDTGAGEVE